MFGPLEAVVLLMVLGVYVAIAYAIARYAERKGYSFRLFAILAVLVWPLALLIALLLYPKPAAYEAHDRSDASDGELLNEDLERLERLAKLRDMGALTMEEFEAEKAKILAVPTGN